MLLNNKQVGFCNRRHLNSMRQSLHQLCLRSFQQVVSSLHHNTLFHSFTTTFLSCTPGLSNMLFLYNLVTFHMLLFHSRLLLCTWLLLLNRLLTLS